MKLSDYTLSVLKNFSTINSGIVLRRGNVQKTMSPEKSILVEAELDESIPSSFGIYDLNQFLGNATTMNSPELEFSEKSVSMKDDTFTLYYLSCSPELIITPPDKELVINDPDATVDLTHATLTKILRLASMNDLPHVSFVAKDGELKMQAHEKSNPSSNHVFTSICEYHGNDFTATFKTENLKIIPDDYTVVIKSGAFAKFSSKNRKLTYFIAMETKESK